MIELKTVINSKSQEILIIPKSLGIPKFEMTHLDGIRLARLRHNSFYNFVVPYARPESSNIYLEFPKVVKIKGLEYYFHYTHDSMYLELI